MSVGIEVMPIAPARACCASVSTFFASDPSKPLPAVWEAVLLRALARTPVARFPSVAALQAALDVGDGEAPTWQGPAPTTRL